ncbi:MAG: leucine-rich repeat protein [Clostridia bacterium]|nr:leucine-rich repeat protein [Clostridia bacterium]
MKRKTWCKFLTWTISILLACGLCIAASAENTSPDDFVIEGKTLVKYTGEGGEVTVPEGIEVLADEAFQSTGVTKVNLPETVKELGHHCFYNCYALTEITLPASLNGLAKKTQVFGSNYALEAFSVAEGSNYIVVDGVLFTADGKTLLYYPEGKQDTEYSIPEGTVILGASSFGNPCLEKLNIPSTMKDVGGDYVAFVGLSNLREINVSPDNKVFRSIDGVLYTSDTLMCYPNEKAGDELKAEDFPAGLKRIAHNAFWGNHYLENVEFPEGLKYLGGKVFLGARSLKTAVIPASVKTISYYSFTACKELERVTILNPDVQPEDYKVDDPKTYNIFWRANEDAVLCGYAGGRLQAYAEKCGLNFEDLETATATAAETVKETVQEIPETRTEPVETSLDDFVIEGKTVVEYIGKGGEVTVPEGIEALGEYAFTHTNVTRVNLPETLKGIGNYCFLWCYELEEITLPASLEKIGRGQAFAYNVKLDAINVAEGNPNFVSVDGVLFTGDRKQLLYYPSGRNRGGEYAIPEGTVKVGDSALGGTGLTAIDIPSTLAARIDCLTSNPSLREIRVAEGNPSYKSIDGMLFDNNGTLLVYPAGREKESLAPKDFPAEMKAIAPYAFQYAQHLKSVVIPDGITTIEWMCFTFSPSLETVILPTSVNYISGLAFAHCNSLKQVFILNPNAGIMLDDERFSDSYRATKDFNILEDCPNAVLYGFENSTAREYAAQRDDAFVSLGTAPGQGVAMETGTPSDFMPSCQQ